MKPRNAVALALVALSLPATTACGGDDGSSGAGDTTTGQTTTDFTTTAEDNGSAGTLEGETGPGFEIKLRRDGEDVTTLSPGTYTISVEDQSSIHNFHLVGPGVDEEITDVPFEGEKSVTVTLQAGEYTFQCDPHASNMNGTFTVS